MAQGALASIGNTPLQLTATPTLLALGITLKAAAGNSGAVYIGFANTVTPGTTPATDGYELSAGEELFLPVGLVAGASLIWVVAASASQKLYWLGL
jgi:hypothetical protein